MRILAIGKCYESNVSILYDGKLDIVKPRETFSTIMYRVRCTL
jgi:hypothetical protein